MKKKLLLIVSMLAVTFMFAGCGASEEDGVKFDYTEQEIAQVAKSTCQMYREYASEEATYNYIVEAGADAGVPDSEIEAVKSFRNIGNECGEFIDFTGEYKIEEVEDSVIVTLYADCTETEALIKVTFVDNSATYNLQKYQLTNQYGYSEEEADELLVSQELYPYKSTDVEIAANMTFKDKMSAAGVHTLIGMATVFAVLIFISFMIYLLRFVPVLFDKEARKAKKEAKKAAVENTEADSTETVSEPTAPVGQVVDIVKTETGESVMNDSELVAVITAAVAAASAGPSTYITYPSKDTLVTRSIRRIKR